MVCLKRKSDSSDRLSFSELEYCQKFHRTLDSEDMAGSIRNGVRKKTLGIIEAVAASSARIFLTWTL